MVFELIIDKWGVFGYLKTQVRFQTEEISCQFTSPDYLPITQTGLEDAMLSHELVPLCKLYLCPLGCPLTSLPDELVIGCFMVLLI